MDTQTLQLLRQKVHELGLLVVGAQAEAEADLTDGDGNAGSGLYRVVQGFEAIQRALSEIEDALASLEAIS
jgi:hypothetical protein